MNSHSAFDKTVIQEIPEGDFTEYNFLALARSVEGRQQWPRPLNPKHFFNVSRLLMQGGAMKVWGCDSALLGGLFVKNMFAGEPEAIVSFLWSFNPRHTRKLWDLFHDEAKRFGCIRMAAASFGKIRSGAMRRMYRMKGFEESEHVYTKFL